MEYNITESVTGKIAAESLVDRVAKYLSKKVKKSICDSGGKGAKSIKKILKIFFVLDKSAYRRIWFSDAMIQSYLEKGERSKALKEYLECGRLFWHAEEIGKYLEDKGRIEEAMIEYEYLIKEYMRMGEGFLPLPKGPNELFKLGRWYVSRDQQKARKYLRLYLSAKEVWSNDPAFFLEYEEEAKKYLKKCIDSKVF